MDTLIFPGGEVKALDNKGRIGGHIVLFTTKHDPDTSGDYFDSDTDFDLEDGDRLSGYYRHGFDVKIGNRKIAKGNVTKDDKGLWLEAQLDEREKYLEEIMEMVSESKLGYSTGALSHLVRREAKNKVATLNYVSHWPLKEFSLLPDPCEPRTLAVSLKMWAEALPKIDPADSEMLSAVSIATIRELEQALRDGVKFSVKDAKTIASRFALRDVEPPQPQEEAPPVVIIPASDPEAEFAVRQLARRQERIRLALT